MIFIFPLICLGMIFAGVLIIRHRSALWQDTRDRQRRLAGRRVSGVFERLQSAFGSERWVLSR